jgi:hypothetical protein
MPFRIVNLDEQAVFKSCTTEILADHVVTYEKIAPSAIDSDNLADGSITAIKLGSDVFGAGLVANGTTNAIDLNVDNVTLEISSNLVQLKAGGVNQTHITLTGNIDFGNYEILKLRVENVNADPTPGNAGRLIWRTDLNQLKVDDGTSFTSIGSGSGGHIIEDEGTPVPQRATLNFVGSGVTVTDSGSKSVVTIPGGGGVGSYGRDLVVVVNPLDKTIPLSNTPISNSEVVSWNGLILKPGVSNDYTISGSTVTLNSAVTLTIGDELQVVYAY